MKTALDGGIPKTHALCVALQKIAVRSVQVKASNLKTTPSPYFGDKKFGPALLRDPMKADAAVEYALQRNNLTLDECIDLGLEHIAYDGT